MPPQLPQSYKFKYFYFNKNPIVVGPLVILDPNVVFLSHGRLAFSLTSLNESLCPPKEGLFIYSNPIAKK